jgi:hypothetical protein
LSAFFSELTWFDGFRFLFYNDALALTFFVFRVIKPFTIIPAILLHWQVNLSDHLGTSEFISLDIFDHCFAIVFS